MSLEEFSKSLYSTTVSTGLRETAGVIPTIQSLHVVAIAVVVGSILAMELRLAGLLAVDEMPGTLVRRFLPWLLGAVCALAVTGSILVIAEPNRVLSNPFFWSKMALLLSVVAFNLLFRYPLLHPDALNRRGYLLSKSMAWFSILLWIAIISCGRWIAYAI